MCSHQAHSTVTSGRARSREQKRTRECRRVGPARILGMSITGVRSSGLAALLLGLGVGWGAGNVGPVVLDLGAHFHTTLAAVGLLSGTVYFAAVMVATPFAVPLAARALGGVRLLGLFGGSITLGIAVALGLGSALDVPRPRDDNPGPRADRLRESNHPGDPGTCSPNGRDLGSCS